jgi:short-chain Z-isoprenyl diphosphate synthase
MDMIYRWYGRRLKARLRGAELPRHVALVMDGNRRWAREMGLGDVSEGHRHGAQHLERVLDWCAEVGIRQVTVFLASLDNVRKRDADEVGFIMRMIEEVVAQRMAQPDGRWQVHVAGRLEVLPDSTAHALKAVRDATLDRGLTHHLTVAVGYDGRAEVTDAVRAVLEEAAAGDVSLAELAERITVDDIAAHLYTEGMPDPDLVIRTSGERRLSGFLIWQSAYSELHFCDVYWPGFRQVDFLRALRDYVKTKS